MNFVIFCYNFPPMCNAEAFCSARFASALAQAGHNVHVVTMDHVWAVDESVYNALVDKTIKITRIKQSDKTGFKFFSRIKYRLRRKSACEIAHCVKALRKALIETDSPILISRSLPEMSNIVAWYCRKYAAKWIAHFSDPFPFSMGRWRTYVDYVFNRWEIMWGKRIIRDSSVVSITCEAAKQYFHDFYGPIFDNKKVIVTAHIGEPPLKTKRTWQRDCKGVLVVHAGGLWVSRGAKQVAEAFEKLNQNGCNFYFCQVGEIEKEAKCCFENKPWAKIIDNDNPDLAAAVLDTADICFISDMKTSLSYSPFLPSKFVYQLFTDTPIVACSVKNSEMFQFAQLYPEAGVIFADSNVNGSLVRAFMIASQVTKKGVLRDRIRGAFTRKAIQKLYESQ